MAANDDDVSAAEATKLAGMVKLLGPHRADLAKSGARHKASLAGSHTELAALLQRKGYPVHASVLAFDHVFGGLMIPEADAAEDWFETDEAIVVGAFACLSSDGHSSPRGGREDLVPIAYTPNDCIVYLDAAGAAYFEDTIEDERAEPWAPTGSAAVGKLLTWG